MQFKLLYKVIKKYIEHHIINTTPNSKTRQMVIVIKYNREAIKTMKLRVIKNNKSQINNVAN